MAFESRRTVIDRGPNTVESLRRVVALIFGIIQGLIGLRILLLLLDARQDNGLVHAVMTASAVFIAPFDGVLRTNVIKLGGPEIDATAIVALIGWTILEWVILAALSIFRGETRTETVRVADPPAGRAPAQRTNRPAALVPDEPVRRSQLRPRDDLRSQTASAPPAPPIGYPAARAPLAPPENAAPPPEAASAPADTPPTVDLPPLYEPDPGTPDPPARP